MPYRPEELTSQEQPLDVVEEVKTLSERIDTEMLRDYRGGSFRFQAGSCHDVVLDALQMLYRHHGWHMSWKRSTCPLNGQGWDLLFEPLSSTRRLPLDRPKVEAAAR